ncbi:hypothetical protein [Microvirga pudoricolor]|uniref:hypothetical protein n=1 Tax=Microvirga pudoricolor TaxID=2778729 RepID=UPI00194DF5F4|nr:hypothetical protein [Microvirga pudoricolor]MBM6594268.1 hypothetical protein [Microvirga pudoricolor]
MFGIAFDFARAQRAHRIAASGLALALLAFPGAGLAQEAPRPIPRQPAPTVTAPDTTPIRIVLVEWRIKKGREKEFLDYWSTQATIKDRTGLIGEYLSRVEDQKQYPWMVWNLDPNWTTFVNVGFWRNGADFQEQIGKFIDNSRPPQAFEAERRRRVFIAPERWRLGPAGGLQADHPAVK